jgi:hypothetical protein
MNIVNLKKDQNDQSSVKIVSIPHYQTTDGRNFRNKTEAEAHQRLLNKADELTRQNLGSVYGTTPRGWGTEFVNASYGTLHEYTVRILEELKQNNRYFP